MPTIQVLSPQQALNRSLLRYKPQREEFERFRLQLQALYRQSQQAQESEAFNQGLLSDFLKNSFYSPEYFINTKDYKDLVIHNGAKADSPVAVIFELKKPGNRAEMPSLSKPNSKALQELVLYYLRERFEHQNLEIKHLIITNISEWFIFDAQWFERNFAQNVSLVKQFKDFEQGRLANKKTDFFYREIAKPFIEGLEELSFCHFDLSNFETALQSEKPEDWRPLIPVFKLLSPLQLLKQPWGNDSNSLDQGFYEELLHLMGLTEVRVGAVSLIKRLPPEQRQAGSLLEETIDCIEGLDRLKGFSLLEEYGESAEEQSFEIALNLCITWVNRILFLKLLEAQLLSYHQGQADYAFLNSARIKSFHELNDLFFRVLAKPLEERSPEFRASFEKVPYLNSSLFEATELERQVIFLSCLNSHVRLNLHERSVLQDEQGKKRQGSMPTLAYIFEFLEAYDFGREDLGDWRETQGRLINASVLGLIFEKINGYQDGAFFTPGFVSMYMSRETIRQAVLHKFNRLKNWDCADFKALYQKIEDIEEANTIVNSLKIVDPAVGSGHFLVSALNELICIKHDLRILCDRQGYRLKEYHFEVANDELIITDERGEAFVYKPRSQESQRVQEALFHEKQQLIENCLFGVDLNPNSVKICRLRLWIELLKHAYYKNRQELETLPNIDINIKRGNSLISRFALNDQYRNLPPVVQQKLKLASEQYKTEVFIYKSTRDRQVKQEAEARIQALKETFSRLANPLDEDYLRWKEAEAKLGETPLLFSTEEREAWLKKTEALAAEVAQLQQAYEQKLRALYRHAFEWRFEFPEVLDEDGQFKGFDAILGNPPYGINFNKSQGALYGRFYQSFNWRGESYTLFIERALGLLAEGGYLGFIIPDTLLNLGFTQASRQLLLQQSRVYELDLLPAKVFPAATVDTILLFFQKQPAPQGQYNRNEVLVRLFDKKRSVEHLYEALHSFYAQTETWHRLNSFNLRAETQDLALLERVEGRFPRLGDLAELFYGIKAYQVGKGKPAQTEAIRDSKPFTANEQKTPDWLPFYEGKDIGTYCSLWAGQNWIDYGPWLAEPRKPSIFEGEKILIRKIVGQTLIAHYLAETAYCNTLLFVLKLRPDSAKLSYKALLGLLNSRFIAWYFRKKFQISADDTFPQIMIRDIEQFPIPNEDNALMQTLDKAVSALLDAKASPEQASCQALEAEVNRLVYIVYGLSEAEIALVEG